MTSRFTIPFFSRPVLILQASTCWLLLSLFMAVHGEDGNAAAQPKPTVRILMIGNSFAQNVSTYFPEIARDGGMTPVLLNTMKSGCSLEQHAKGWAACATTPDSPEARIYVNNRGWVAGGDPSFPEKFNLIEALKADKWDYVTIQQYSALSYKPETYEPYARQIIDAVHLYAPQAEILVHETWAYREDDPLFKKGDFTQQKMYDGLKAAYAKLAADYHLRIIPTGDAFQAARATERWHYVPDSTYDFTHPVKGTLPTQIGSLNMGWIWSKGPLVLDAHHANQAGKYLGGLVLFETLTGKDVEKLTYGPPGLDPAAAVDLRHIAHETVQASRSAPRHQW